MACSCGALICPPLTSNSTPSLSTPLRRRSSALVRTWSVLPPVGERITLPAFHRELEHNYTGCSSPSKFHDTSPVAGALEFCSKAPGWMMVELCKSGVWHHMMEHYVPDPPDPIRICESFPAEFECWFWMFTQSHAFLPSSVEYVLAHYRDLPAYCLALPTEVARQTCIAGLAAAYYPIYDKSTAMRHHTDPFALNLEEQYELCATFPSDNLLVIIETPKLCSLLFGTLNTTFKLSRTTLLDFCEMFVPPHPPRVLSATEAGRWRSCVQSAPAIMINEYIVWLGPEQGAPLMHTLCAQLLEAEWQLDVAFRYAMRDACLTGSSVVEPPPRSSLGI